jgi:hypothetical protein
MSCRACARLIPGLRRATAVSQRQPLLVSIWSPPGRISGRTVTGTHRSKESPTSVPTKRRGRTPMIVKSWLLSITCRPTTPESPAKARCQKACEMTAEVTACVSSSARNVRPRIARTRSVSKRFHDASTPQARCDGPSIRTFISLKLWAVMPSKARAPSRQTRKSG